MASFQHGRVLHLSTFTIPTTTIPTTTYSFTYTTGSHLSMNSNIVTSLSTPYLAPTYATFAPRQECCNRWSQIPQDPTSRNASCVISNAACDNAHAFWDLYACCNGAEVKEAGVNGFGEFNGCQATCDAIGQSWQDLMTCLEKRAKVVVCKPDDTEIEGGRAISATNEAVPTTTAAKGVANCGTRASDGATASCVPTVNATESIEKLHTGSASSMEVGATKGFKFGVVVVVVMSLGSIAGGLV